MIRGLRRYLAFASVPLLFLRICLTSASAQDDLEASYAKIRPSLVLVETFKGKKLIKTGSGFVVGHRNRNALLLTNRHVIEGGDTFVALSQFPKPTAFKLTVVKRGSSVDLALLEATKDYAPEVTLAADTPPLGHHIAIAGYPRTQLNFAQLGLGLTPSLHAGTVNALPGSGYYIQYDAQSEPGNSGGPLFDEENGSVYAVVVLKMTWSNESNLAIAGPGIRAFLASAGVPQDRPTALSHRRELVATAPTPTPEPSPTPEPTPSIDASACSKGIYDFNSAYNDLNASYNRYAAATKNTASSAQSASNRWGFIAANVFAGYELKAIRSVIDAEEPKLDLAQTEIEGSRATNIAQLTNSLVQDIHERDQDALNWSTVKQQLLDNLANGGSGYQLDQTPLNEGNRLTSSIGRKQSEMRFSQICEH